MSWKIPHMWEGADVWIIGGGPSIITQFGIPDSIVQDVLTGKQPMSAYSPYMSSIHNKHVIGVNATYALGDWIDICFYGDNNFYLQYREHLALFPNLKVTCHDSGLSQPWLKVVGKDYEHPKGISTRSDRVSWNGNSGAAAISLAAWTGAKRILLLGFDMKLNENKRQHFHDVYHRGEIKEEQRLMKLPFDKHLRGFAQIKIDATNLGIQIINVNPDSAIPEFPKMSLKEVLNGSS